MKMPASYSRNFHKKVIDYVNDGNNCNQAAIKFNISPNTAMNWYKRYKSEGHYLSKQVGGKKSKLKEEEVID